MTRRPYASTLRRIARDALAEAGCRLGSLDEAAATVIAHLLEDDRVVLTEAIEFTRAAKAWWFKTKSHEALH